MPASLTRRRALAVGGLTLASLAGCTDSSSTPPTAASDPTDTATTTNAASATTTTPTCRQVVDLSVSAESASQVRTVIGGEFIALRSVSATGTYAAVVESTRDAVRSSVAEAGLSLRSLASFDYCGEPLCDARVKARLPTQNDVTPPNEAFPDAVATYRAETASTAYWTVYFRTDSPQEAATALADAGYDTSAASVFSLAACDEQSTGDGS
ncbi:hypothetical protein [Salarchaeum japonicum]|uniref:hypothetical protein n=1 Tax=Salarchaeum japonicum TaxID=555573 RepID=UPI003C7138B3